MAEKWVQGAIKRPGALRRKLGVSSKTGRIPAGKVAETISRLQEKAKGDKKLSAEESRTLKQALLARTLGKMRRKK